jgi:hypothetical protein
VENTEERSKGEETMNYKSLVIIALALCLIACVPVSATWNNGNWVSEEKNAKCDQVKFDPKTGVTSCYHDINPATILSESEQGLGGHAVGSVRAGYSTLSDTITVRNVLQPENSTPMTINVNPDATFEIPGSDNGVLAPGEYEATLDNFNLPDETVKFTISANQQGPTRIAFLGQAVSAPATHQRTIEIVRASYGATNEVCEQIQHEAWVEHRGSYSRHCDHSFKGHCMDWDYEDVGVGNGDYIRSCWGIYSYIAPINHEAYTETKCHTEGSFITVTSIVQSKVVDGNLHLVSDYPNLGYNAMFTDPSPGIFKTLSVDYKINGGSTIHKVVAEDVDLII